MLQIKGCYNFIHAYSTYRLGNINYNDMKYLVQQVGQPTVFDSFINYKIVVLKVLKKFRLADILQFSLK